jgi:hypothetical protein
VLSLSSATVSAAPITLLVPRGNRAPSFEGARSSGEPTKRAVQPSAQPRRGGSPFSLK